MSSRSGRRLTTEQRKLYRQRRLKKKSGHKNKHVNSVPITPGYHTIHYALESFIMENLRKYQPDKIGGWRIIRELTYIPYITAVFNDNFVCWEASVYSDDLVMLRFTVRTAKSTSQDFFFRSCFSAPDFFDELTKFIDDFVPRFAFNAVANEATT